MAELKEVKSKKNLYGAYLAILVPLGVALDVVGKLIIQTLGLPIYMDTFGTIIVGRDHGPVGRSADRRAQQLRFRSY